MRTFAMVVIGVGALLAGCGGGDMKTNVGGSGGSDEGGAAGSDEGGSGGSSGGITGTNGGSGGSAEKMDAAPAEGGSGGGDTGGSGGGDTGGSGGSGGSTPETIADGGTSSGGDGAVSVGPVDMTGLTKIFDGTSTMGWTSTPAGMFNVSNGALVASGKGRGAFATNGKYGHYRILFSLKPGGTGGHAPTVLVFCLYPGKDALGGIQFQPPKGGHWDYRPGKNNAGGTLFTKAGNPGPAGADGFYKCEIIANNMTGEAKMACGGADVLHFKDMTAAGAPSPFAIQTHNAGISDQYKDIYVQDNITDDKYLTVK